jgi:hypothetical protein
LDVGLVLSFKSLDFARDKFLDFEFVSNLEISYFEFV